MDLTHALASNGTGCISWKLGYCLQGILPSFKGPPATKDPHRQSSLGPLCNCQAPLVTFPHQFNRMSRTSLPAPLGLHWLCGTPNNFLKGPRETLEVWTYSHLDNSQQEGDCTLGTRVPRGIIILNITQTLPKIKWAFDLILEGAIVAISALAPWGVFTYHEISLR